MKDNMVTCKRCGGNACYEQNISEEVKTWLCFGCGWSTSSVMDKKGEAAAAARESSPELYRELEFVDDDNLSWFPATITLPEKGMVFLNGTSSKEFGWSAVKAVKLTKEEIKSGKYPEGNEWKMDMFNKKDFDRRDFMNALEVIGFYEA